MFLNQVHFAWRDLGWASWRRAALLVLAPYLLIAVLVLPTSFSTPPVANHAELSGTGTHTGPQTRLGGSYQMTFTITGKAGCSFQVSVGGTGGGYGLGEFSFPSGSTQSRRHVWRMDLPDLTDGRYAITTTATGCGPWMVSIDRATNAG